MSEMIDRVAAAIEAQMARDDNMPEDVAKAAIEAMRNPTLHMVHAGSVSIANQFTDPFDVLNSNEEEALGLEVEGLDSYAGADERLTHFAEDAWKDMIDTALIGKHPWQSQP